jgi:3-oxoacid CoA-transferase subunit A
MIKNYLVTGDTHGRVMERLQWINPDIYKPEETAVIVLGDAGLNYYLNKTDTKNKKIVNDSGFRLYCVRGNHEERPNKIESVNSAYDSDLGFSVWMESEFPNIRYLMDGGVYNIHNQKTLVVGGAYSVDKEYRLAHFPPDAKWTGWFKDEQLSYEEMNLIERFYQNQSFDVVLSHTCPYSWQPTDLFLSGIDQSTVDNSMEKWLDRFKDEIAWKKWYWGHFHADRDYGDGRKMMYQGIEEF